MKVSAVNFQQNFKGLMRANRTIKDERYFEPAYEADLGTYTERTTLYYHPFADETQEETDRFVKTHTKKDVQTPNNPNACDQTTKIIETVVKVEEPLPITKNEYNDYIKAMNMAKKLYDENSEIMRHAFIRALVDENTRQTENTLLKAGFDELTV